MVQRESVLRGSEGALVSNSFWGFRQSGTRKRERVLPRGHRGGSCRLIVIR